MPGPLDFDPGLPRLGLIDDNDAVCALLAPGAERDKLQRQDTKYEPGIRCVAAYRISTEPSRPPLLGAVVVTPERVDGFVATDDPALPWLAEALDGAAVAEAHRFPGEGSRRPTSCRATAVRYKPGVRCTVRYDLDGPVRARRHFAKLLAGDPSPAASVIDQLRLGLVAGTGAPLVPSVTVWPNLHMVVQAAAPMAREAHRIIGDRVAPLDDRRDLMHRVGAALAALQSVPLLPDAPVRSFADDLDELRGYLPGVRLVDAALGARFAHLVDLLARDDRPEKAAVTSHGAFRTDQLVVSGDELVLIDLDTLCRAEPARDIGNLLAYLDWKAIRSPADATAFTALEESFLKGYAGRVPLPLASRITAQRAACLVKIAGRRVRSLTVAEWRLLPTLLDAAGRRLGTPALEPR
jgi:hypothetical protein